jgi:hypothetical protein
MRVVRRKNDYVFMTSPAHPAKCSSGGWPKTLGNDARLIELLAVAGRSSGWFKYFLFGHLTFG